MSRTAEVIYIGDAASIVRASQESKDAVSGAEGSITKSHANIASSFGSMVKKVALSAVGFGAAYASIAGVKDAVKSTTELTEGTVELTRVLGLNVGQASAWASVAKVNDISTRSLAQSFGTLSKNSNAALDAQTAGTAGTNKQAEAFKELGITQSDLVKGKSDFQGLLDKVNDSFQTMPGGTEKASIGMTLLGRGWQTLVPLMRSGAEGMDAQLAEAQKMGATLGGSSVDSLEKFKVAQQDAQYGTVGLQLAMGQYLAPVLATVIGGVANLVAGFRAGTGAGGDIRDALNQVVTAGEGVVNVMKSIVQWFEQHQTVAIVLAGAIAGVALNLGLVTLATGAWSAAVAILNIDLLADPVVALGVALAALAGGLVALELKTDFVQKAWKDLKTVFSDVVTWIDTAATGIVTSVGGAWTTIKATASTVWDEIKTVLKDAWNVIVTIFKDATIVGLIAGHWTDIKSAASGAWVEIKKVIVTPVNDAIGTVEGALGDKGLTGWLTGAWTDITKGVTGFATTIASGVVSAFDGAVNLVIGFINDIIGAIDLIPGVNIGKIKPIVTSTASSTAGRGGAQQVAGRATGGTLVNHPMFMVGEEAPAHPEYVIATNPAYRSRNLGLWADAGKQLGIPGFATGGVLGPIESIGGAIGGAVSGAANAITGLLSSGASWILDKLPGVDSLPSWLSGMGSSILGDATSFVKNKVSGFLSGLLGSSSGGSGYSTSQLETFWEAGGGPTSVARTAAAISDAESGGSNVIQKGQPYGTTGWGLWQITPGDSEPQFGINEALLNPINNAKAAVAKFRGAGSTFAPWTTYEDGAYQQFMAMGGIFGEPFGGARAAGGPVSPGYVYRVGENGPENFVPGTRGTIMSAAQTRNGLYGGIHIHGDLKLSGTQAARAMVDRLAYRVATGTA